MVDSINAFKCIVGILARLSVFYNYKWPSLHEKKRKTSSDIEKGVGDIVRVDSFVLCVIAFRRAFVVK